MLYFKVRIVIEAGGIIMLLTNGKKRIPISNVNVV